MGFGTAPFGEGLWGLDPLPDPSPSTVATPAAALLFDLKTRTFPRTTDGTGNLQSIHSVDQKVALAMGIIKNKLRPVPNQGTSYAALNRLAESQLQPAAEKIVRGNPIIAALVRAKDITIVSIVAVAAAPGNDQIALVYSNNRTGQRGSVGA